MKTVKSMLTICAAAALLGACSDDNEATTATPSSEGNLTLNISGLEQLGDGYVYEGWVIVDDAPISTGTFTSVTFPQSFEVDQTMLDNASRFVLSIEPAVDPDPAPAPTKLLAGDFDGSSASISYAPIDNRYADLEEANLTGYAFLRTPTDEPAGTMNNGNDQAGIWFGSPGMPPAADLDLPDLTSNTGWTYEGWIVVNGTPYSTGTFNNPRAADDNTSSSMVKGSANDGPPIPGEDFIQNLENTGFAGGADLRGGTAVISIEPVPDDSPAPFTLKPLAAMVGQDTAPARYLLNENFDSFPTGTITRK